MYNCCLFSIAGGYPRWELRQVVVNGIDRKQCDADYDSMAITDNMICAGASGKDACQVRYRMNANIDYMPVCPLVDLFI